MSSLRDIQRSFLSLVAGARDESAEDERRRRIAEGLVLSDRRLDAASRVGVYANMYFLRLRDVLRDDFKKVRAVVGDDAFDAMTRDYLAAHPPTTPLIRDISARLPSFLAAGAPAARERAWLADLAALEWARVDVFDRRDADVLTLEHLRDMGQRAISGLTLEAMPAFCIVPVRYAVEAIWRRVHDGEPPGEPKAEPGSLIVWRSDVAVYHRRATEAEAPLLGRLAGGLPFSDVCEHFAERHSLEDAARVAWETVGNWTAAGLLTLPNRP